MSMSLFGRAFGLFALAALVCHAPACGRSAVEVATGDLFEDADASAEPVDIPSDEEPMPPPDTFVARIDGLHNTFALTETSDHGLALAGIRHIDWYFDNDIIVMKMDGQGRVLWKHQVGWSATDFAGALVETADRSLVAAGFVSDNLGTKDAWVMKVDAEGRVAWHRTLGISGGRHAHDERLDAALALPDGRILLAGRISNPDFDDAWVLCMDASGNVLWQRRYGGGGEEQAYYLSPASDGGFIMAAGTTSFPELRDRQAPWLVRLDRDGTVLWQRAVPLDLDWDVTARETLDHGLVAAATIIKGQIQAWVMRLDSLGALQWSLLLEPPLQSYRQDYGGDIVQSPEGRIFFGGGTQSPVNFCFDMWLAELGGDGNFLWERMVKTVPCDVAGRLTIARDGAIMAAAGGGDESHVARLTPDGGFEGSCPLLSSIESRAVPLPVELVEIQADWADTDLMARDADLEISEPGIEVTFLCN